MMFTGVYPLVPHAWRAFANKHELGDRPVRAALAEWAMAAALSAMRPAGFLPLPGAHTQGPRPVIVLHGYAMNRANYLPLAYRMSRAGLGPIFGFEYWTLGRIAAGTPISAIQSRSHTIALPPDLLTSGEHFALEVRGDSMIEAGILDGDIALIRKTEAADTGDIVVALIDDEEATLKRFRRRGASIALEPANPSYEVRILPPNRVRIQGKLVGLFRRY